MAELYTDEWYAAVHAAADDLPVVDGVSFVFDIEVSDAPGKKRAHGRVVNGRLESLVAGKFVPAHDDDVLEVNFATKGKYIASLLSGEVAPMVAYMRGELKVDGAYERVVDHLANKGDREALARFRSAVAAATD